MTKKPTAAQLAARKLFAQRAKAGAFKRKTRTANPATKKTIARKGVSKAAYVARPSQATRKAPSKRLAARRKKAVGPKAVPGYFPNPQTVARKTVKRQALVGGVHYAVLWYARKSKPSGRPDLVFPARDRAHAMAFIRTLNKQAKAQGVSGCVLLEKTISSVSG